MHAAEKGEGGGGNEEGVTARSSLIASPLEWAHEIAGAWASSGESERVRQRMGIVHAMLRLMLTKSTSQTSPRTLLRSHY